MLTSKEEIHNVHFALSFNLRTAVVTRNKMNFSALSFFFFAKKEDEKES